MSAVQPSDPRRARPLYGAAPTQGLGVRRLRQAAIGFGLVSAVGVGLGITFGLAAKSRNDASNRDAHCDASGCDGYGAERREAALDAARVATWSLAAAGAFGATALVLHFKAESATSTQLATSLVDGSPSVSLRGRF